MIRAESASENNPSLPGLFEPSSSEVEPQPPTKKVAILNNQGELVRETFCEVVKLPEDDQESELEIRIEGKAIYAKGFCIDHSPGGKLGKGGFGVVRRAYPYYYKNGERQVLNYPIAVKNLKGVEEKYIQAELNANVLFPVKRVGDKLFMPLINGRTLKDYLKKIKPEDTEKQTDIICQLAKLLQTVNNDSIFAEAIVYYDLKSSNILITDDGKVHLIDFGLSLKTNQYQFYYVKVNNQEDMYRIGKKWQRPFLFQVGDQFYMQGCSKDGQWEFKELDAKTCKSSKLIFTPVIQISKENEALDQLYEEINKKNAHIPKEGVIYYDKRGTSGLRPPEMFKKGGTGLESDIFTFGGLVAFIFGAEKFQHSRLKTAMLDIGFSKDEEKESKNNFNIEGMLKHDQSLTPRQRQAIIDFQQLMTHMEPKIRRDFANIDLTVRFFHSVKLLLILNKKLADPTNKNPKDLQKKIYQHEAEIILLSCQLFPGGMTTTEHSSFDYENRPDFCEAVTSLDKIGMFRTNLVENRQEIQSIVLSLAKPENEFRCKIISKLQSAGLLFNFEMDFILRYPIDDLTTAFFLPDPMMTYLYLHSKGSISNALSDEQLIKAFEILQNNSKNENYQTYLTTLTKMIIYKMKEKSQPVTKLVSLLSFMSSSKSVEVNAIQCFENLLKGKISIQKFQSKYADEQKILCNHPFKELTNPIFKILQVNKNKSRPEKAAQSNIEFKRSVPAIEEFKKTILYYEVSGRENFVNTLKDLKDGSEIAEVAFQAKQKFSGLATLVLNLNKSQYDFNLFGDNSTNMNLWFQQVINKEIVSFNAEIDDLAAKTFEKIGISL